ncbi:MAG: hypothetical protein AAF289_05205 [Cyanobacteria bacterium P01_A01_bin.135]
MTTHLTPHELLQAQHLLQNYQPAQPALTTLTQTGGDLEISFNQLWAAQTGQQTFSETQSIWQIAREEFRRELCDDEGFRAKIQNYLKNPTDAAALTAAILYIVELAALSAIVNPAIATVVVLYIAKVGLQRLLQIHRPVRRQVRATAITNCPNHGEKLLRL